MGDAGVGRRGRRLGLGLAIVIWTAVAWGGRIGLLAESDSIWAWARIGGSVLVGLLVALALVSAIGDGWADGVIVLFVVWTTVLWARSLAVNWMGDGSPAFILVHTVLAAGFFTLAWFVCRERRRPAIFRSAS